LLVLAVPSCAERIDALIAATDGAIIVGEVGASEIPEERVIGAVLEEQQRATQPYMRPPPGTEQISGRQPAAFGGLGLRIVAALVAAWSAYRPRAGRLSALGREPDCAALAANGNPCTPRTGEPTVAMTPDSAQGEALRDSGKPSGVVPKSRLAVANPGDSSA